MQAVQGFAEVALDAAQGVRIDLGATHQRRRVVLDVVAVHLLEHGGQRGRPARVVVLERIVELCPHESGGEAGERGIEARKIRSERVG